MSDNASKVCPSPALPRGVGCLSDLALDQIVAAGARPEDASTHLAGCDRCRARLELLEDSSHRTAASTERLLQAALASARRPALPARGRWRWFTPRLALTAVAVAGLASVMLVHPWSRTAPSATTPVASLDELRVKGTTLRFYVLRDGKVLPGHSGGAFRAGDALRFVVSTGAPSFFFLVGADSSGKVSAYHPFGGHASTKIAPATDVPLPGSLVLDDARGTEFFIGIFSAEPLSLGRVEAALDQALGKRRRSSAEPPQLALPGSHHWVVIRKE